LFYFILISSRTTNEASKNCQNNRAKQFQC
jgi:hypothetical protein